MKTRKRRAKVSQKTPYRRNRDKPEIEVKNKQNL